MPRILLTLAFVAITLTAQSFVETIAGTAWIFPPTPIPALQAPIGPVESIVADAAGNLFIADPQNHIVLRIDTRGILTAYAGNGIQGYSGDNIPAVQAELDQPTGVAFDPQGNLLIADPGNGRIFRVDRAGILTTIAGGGNNPKDGATALTADIKPWSLALDSRGILYFAEFENDRVRQIDANGIVKTVAGTGEDGVGQDGIPATQSKLSDPISIAVDAAGLLYITDSSTHRIRRVRANGIIETIAGTGDPGTAGLGALATRAQLNEPQAIHIDRNGNIFIADNLRAGRILRIDPSGVITAFVPNTQFNNPHGIAFTTDSTLYVTENGSRTVRRIANGAATVFAGNGRYRYTGDGGPAIAATLNYPQGMAYAPDGSLYFADSGNARIRRVRPDGVIETVRTGALRNPTGLALDAAGNLYISEPEEGIVYRVTTNGTQTTLTTVPGSAPVALAFDSAGTLHIADGANSIIRRISATGAALEPIRADLQYPRALAFDFAGNLYISDAGNNRVRRVTRAGTASTVAGNGSDTSSGDNGPATAAGLDVVNGVAVDAQGNLYIATNSRIRVVDSAGTIRTLAGGPAAGYTGDGGPPLDADVAPSDFALGRNGDLYFTQYYYSIIRAIRSAAPTYRVTPGSLSLNALAGANETAAAIEIRGSTAALAFTAKAAGGNWLSVSPEAGRTPGALTVTARTEGLAAGTYSARIEITVPFGNPTRTDVPVTLTVNATGPRFTVSTQPINFNSPEGGPPLTATLRAANEGSGAAAFQAAASEAWLRVTPASGSLAAGTFQALSITANPVNLRPGTYSGSIAITAGSDRHTIPVSLIVTAANPKILLSQTGLTFTAVAGGGQPLAQSFAVLNEGGGTLTFSATPSTLSGGNWLRVSPRTNTVERPLFDVAEVDVIADQRTLAAGDYYGQIRVAAANAAPQSVTVVLRVLPAGANPGPDLRPSGLIFSGTSPASQEVLVTNLLNRDISYASGTVTFDGAAWLKHLPTNSSVSPNDPRHLIVQPNFANLAPGVRRGAITLVFDDGTIRNVSVLFVLPPSAPADAKQLTREAASCRSPRLNLTFTQIGDGATARVGQAFPIELRAIDDCGNLVRGNERNANSAVFAKFDNGDPDLRLVPLGDGRWTGTWRPLNDGKNPVTVSGVGVFVEGLDLQAGRIDRQVSFLPSGTTPVVRAGAVVHGASQRADVPIAPGSLVTLYGTNLSERTTGSNPLPLPTESEGTEVLLGGEPLPILFASPGQINAQLPFSLQSNAVLQVVVRRRDQISVPEAFVVAPAQPGIFTKNQQGSGQGIVVRSDQVTLAEPGTPARPGEAIVIYATGLGPVSQPVAAGAPSPSNPLAVVLSPVTVVAGGKTAQVIFAGLTPGFAGLYQVNAILATDTPAGNAVPLLIRVDGRESNVVDIAIQN
ncbi:MAG: SMP-30/gluconolactonase/LRE family protein [Acidobacteria bacterium]|nr:SMP-30/gluconolactonase/LRE family protein [Acidobacteriota bacterium]